MELHQEDANPLGMTTQSCKVESKSKVPVNGGLERKKVVSEAESAL